MPKYTHETLKYEITCLNCGEKVQTARVRMYCSDVCCHAYRDKVNKEQRAIARANAEPVLSLEIKSLQRKQRLAQEAKRMQEEIQAMSLSFSALTKDEVEQVRAEALEKARQGRGKIHAFYMGHSGNV